MSEGTPGHGPDADTRTDAGTGQGATNGRPAPQPVRYGPRNGSPRGANGTTGGNGSNGSAPNGSGSNGSGSNGSGSNGSSSNGRTVPAGSSPQQYRAPQPPSERPTGGTNGTPASGTNGTAGNGAGTNGRHTTPSSYTRPRPGQAPARPEPREQDRAVADARIAAAARNASSARGRDARPSGGTDPASTARTALVPTPPLGGASDDTAVTPAVRPDEDRSEPATGSNPASAAPPAPSEKATGLRGFFGLPPRSAQPTAQAAAPADQPTAAAQPSSAATTTAERDDQPATESTSEGSESTPSEATQERTLTWRDRLGLPPKTTKPEPVVSPDSGPGVPTAAAAAAVAATVAAGSTPPETKATPVGPTTAPGQTELRGPVTPASPVAGTSDTVVIPAVDAGAVAPAAPAAAATAQPLVTAKPKVGLARRTRKARLRLSRVDPWSVMKTAFLFSIAAGIILVVATYGVWSVLNASGLFDAVNDMVKSVVSTPGDTTPFRIEEYVNTQKVLGLAAIIAVIDVLIFTALATLGSFLYNLAATVLGGLEVTLAED